MLHKQGVLRFIKFAVVMIIFTLMITPVMAVDPPLIRVAPQWRPATTLDSKDSGTLNEVDALDDDFRYVEVDIYVTASVQFWTAQLNCTVAPAALTSYEVPDGGNLDPGDDVAVVRWGSDWGSVGNDFTAVVEPFTVTGSRRITAARHWGPLGGNGWNNTFLLATLRYRAKDIAANTTSPFTCAATFLNKDGRVVLAPVYVVPPALSVLTGYTVTARATYQGRISSSGIGMMCDGPDVDEIADFTVTSLTGNFTYNAVRQQGWFGCRFFGNVTNATAGYQPDTFLSSFTWFNIQGSSYQIMPVELAGGNLSRNDGDADPTTTDENIGTADLGVITAPANWEKVAAVGDINADTLTNRADLSIAAGNFGRIEDISGAAFNARHWIYSLPRNWDIYRNSRIWLGEEWSGDVAQLVPGQSLDFWATLSPDGTRLAFARGVGDAGCPHCTTAIFVAPVNNQGVVGTPVRITPANWNSNNYAPSWSPDGTQIAFSCSWWNDNIGGFGFDDGNLCVVSANGSSLRTVANNARIYPPAWYINNAGETFLVYGGSYLNPNCADTLCIKNPSTPDWYGGAVFDANIDAGVATGNTADMPRICNMQGCDHLFYRFNNGSTRILRWANINLDTNDIPAWTTRAVAQAAGVPPYHMDVDYDLDGEESGTDYALPSTDIDYYTVAQNDYDIVFTQTFDSWNFHMIYDVGTNSVPGEIIPWYLQSDRYVFDTVGNIDPPLNPNEPTERHALRNTLDIAP
jgi:hypothetical protein